MTTPEDDGFKRLPIWSKPVDPILDMMIHGVKAQQDRSAVPLNFDCSDADMTLIKQIAARGCGMAKALGHRLDVKLAAMDIATVHCNGTPLRLLALMMSETVDFAVDFTGICNHLDRTTGKLYAGFKPRFAVQS